MAEGLYSKYHILIRSREPATIVETIYTRSRAETYQILIYVLLTSTDTLNRGMLVRKIYIKKLY